MKYLVTRDGKENEYVNTLLDVGKLVADLYPEPNVILYGLQSTLMDMGEACFYQSPKSSDQTIVCKVKIV